MKSILAVSYHDKTPVAASAASIASGALYLACAVLSLLSSNGAVFSLGAAALLAACLAFAGLGALLLTVAKYDQKWACIPLLLSAASSAAFVAGNILSTVASAGESPLTIMSGIVGALFSLVILALAILLILALLGKYFSKKLPLILCCAAAALTLADLMLALILGANQIQTVIFFLAGLAAAASFALVLMSMQPGEYIIVKLPASGPLFGREASNRICPSCGKKAGAGVQFCKFCGTKLNEAQTPVKICPDCSYKAGSAEMEYCVKCGARLIESLPQEEAPDTIEIASVKLPQNAGAFHAEKAAASASQSAPLVQSILPSAPEVTPEQAAARMEKLFDLLGKGIITQDEYDQKRTELIKYL